jgi:hypothetical protein
MHKGEMRGECEGLGIASTALRTVPSGTLATEGHCLNCETGMTNHARLGDEDEGQREARWHWGIGSVNHGSISSICQTHAKEWNAVCP